MLDFTGKNVFMAEVTTGMKAYGENLIKELERYGCAVKTGSKGSQHVSDIMEQCDFAIHLLGDQGHIAESLEEKGILQSLRHYQSRKLVSESKFEIYAWSPKSQINFQYGEGELPNHIYNIQKLEEVELLRTTFEEFKNYIFQKLTVVEEGLPDGHYIKGDEPLQIYFIYDAMDRELAWGYVDLLRKRGFAVVTPSFSRDIMEVRHMHNTALKNFDLAIILANNAGINWINMKVMDILKSPGLGREKDILGKAIFATKQISGIMTSNSKGFDIISIGTDTIQDQINLFLRTSDIDRSPL